MGRLGNLNHLCDPRASRSSLGIEKIIWERLIFEEFSFGGAEEGGEEFKKAEGAKRMPPAPKNHFISQPCRERTWNFLSSSILDSENRVSPKKAKLEGAITIKGKKSGTDPLHLP